MGTREGPVGQPRSRVRGGQEYSYLYIIIGGSVAEEVVPEGMPGFREKYNIDLWLLPAGRGPVRVRWSARCMLRRRGGAALRGREEGAHRYRMREKIIAFGDDYWIEDEAGEKVFKVDGKMLRLRNTLVIQDGEGRDLYKIQERMLRIKDTMEIERGDGGTAATIKKALVAPLRDRWTVKVPGGEDWSVQGNILDHEYRIDAGRARVAEVSKKWFRIRDTYGVEVVPGHDAALVLAVTAAVDQMAHD